MKFYEYRPCSSGYVYPSLIFEGEVALKKVRDASSINLIKLFTDWPNKLGCLCQTKIVFACNRVGS
jgi:hypothetical protein